MQIAVDFDGTCVTFAYPKIGKEIGASPVLHDLVRYNHKLILLTMRCGSELQAAVGWFKNHRIPLFGINENSTQKAWTESPKVYANLYIDDAALGVPLIYPEDARPYVDWAAVKEWLIKNKVLFDGPVLN